MRVTVFGASGKIGRLVVERLLDDGHTVVAYVRTPAKLPVEHARLTIRAGGLDDADAVAGTLNGSDAVISALGPSLKRGSVGTPISDGTLMIVTSMRAAGVRRFIGLATPSVPDPLDEPTIRARALPIVARLAFPGALVDLVGMVSVVTASDLDWTLVRIANPTDGPPTGSVRAGFLGRDRIGFSISRTDIAAFLVSQLTDRTYVHALPAVSNGRRKDRP